jgi:hypothetical protein
MLIINIILCFIHYYWVNPGVNAGGYAIVVAAICGVVMLRDSNGR